MATLYKDESYKLAFTQYWNEEYYSFFVEDPSRVLKDNQGALLHALNWRIEMIQNFDKYTKDKSKKIFSTDMNSFLDEVQRDKSVFNESIMEETSNGQLNGYQDTPQFFIPHYDINKDKAKFKQLLAIEPSEMRASYISITQKAADEDTEVKNMEAYQGQTHPNTVAGKEQNPQTLVDILNHKVQRPETGVIELDKNARRYQKVGSENARIQGLKEEIRILERKKNE